MLATDLVGDVDRGGRDGGVATDDLDGLQGVDGRDVALALLDHGLEVVVEDLLLLVCDLEEALVHVIEFALREIVSQLGEAVPEGGVAGAVKRAEEIQAATPNSILASQFANPANPKVHRETTAREILEQTGGDIDVFVAGIGTGGTLTGVGQVLRQEKPGVKIYGVEPSESPLLSEGQAAPHKIQGLGPNVVPEILDQGIWDELLHIESDVAITYARRAAAEEGLLVGISSGAALAAASELARRPELEGKTIVTVLPDTGERYLSTPLFKDFLD